MKVKTSRLSARALDWAVAKCEGVGCHARVAVWLLKYERGELCYSTDWEQGGPIIEREQIAVAEHYGEWLACKNPCENFRSEDGDLVLSGILQHDNDLQSGKTLLIAAMRCYVSRKLGSEVDIPKELLK